MAVLAVVTSSPHLTEGGHLVIARALVDAARAAGHEAALVVTPDYGFGRTTATYLANRRTDVRRVGGRDVDQIISLRYPSYAVRHSAHVCWLNHTMREYYDLWPRFAATLSSKNRIKESIRRAVLHGVDRWLLSHNVTEVIAQSHTVRLRLAEAFGMEVDVWWPPPPPRPYRCDGYGDYVFAVSRLTPLKRVDLLIRALAEPSARGIRAVVAGEGDEAPSLARLANELGVASRVSFAGRIGDEAMLDHLARCRAVCFTPLAEDYGLVTVEAFASRKAVVTCRDSGGPAELVSDGRTGAVCDPTPAALAAALAPLFADAACAERLGAAAAADAAKLTWPAAIDRLVIV
ncbi:MAG: glycosyltransferase [Betaproteobacteria bacterium]